MTAVSPALSKYANITDELVDLHAQLGELKAQSIRARADTLINSTSSTVTGRHDDASIATSQFEATIALLEAQVSAHLATLRYLDQYLSHLTP